MTSPTYQDPEGRNRTPTPVVLIHPDPHLFVAVAEACHPAGVPLEAVCQIAEIERWPIGQIVVTDLERISPFWQDVGAAHVLAVVQSATQGQIALARGATGWVLAHHAAAAVLALAGVASVSTGSAA